MRLVKGNFRHVLGASETRQDKRGVCSLQTALLKGFTTHWQRDRSNWSRDENSAGQVRDRVCSRSMCSNASWCILLSVAICARSLSSSSCVLLIAAVVASRSASSICRLADSCKPASSIAHRANPETRPSVSMRANQGCWAVNDLRSGCASCLFICPCGTVCLAAVVAVAWQRMGVVASKVYTVL